VKGPQRGRLRLGDRRSWCRHGLDPRDLRRGGKGGRHDEPALAQIAKNVGRRIRILEGAAGMPREAPEIAEQAPKRPHAIDERLTHHSEPQDVPGPFEPDEPKIRSATPEISAAISSNIDRQNDMATLQAC
jgi:hypothetical protein